MVTRPPERRFFVLFMGFWLPVLAYVTVIFALSTQPHLQSPLRFPNGDKLVARGRVPGARAPAGAGPARDTCG